MQKQNEFFAMSANAGVVQQSADMREAAAKAAEESYRRAMTQCQADLTEAKEKARSEPEETRRNALVSFREAERVAVLKAEVEAERGAQRQRERDAEIQKLKQQQSKLQLSDARIS